MSISTGSARVAVQLAPASRVGAPELPETVIEPRPGWRLFDFGELWRCRELLCLLAWRDVSVRYKQTLLGATWAVLQPVLLMLIFVVCLGPLAEVPSGGVPY